MARYAIVIGIGKYPDPEWDLPGAVGDALRFAEWALGPGGVEAGNLCLLLSGEVPPGTSLPFQQADRKTITQAILEFQQDSGKTGDRLYFYYAGHGLSTPTATAGGPPEPVIVPSDIQDLKTDSALLIGFSKIMPLLVNVQPAEQFFFIDACRDFALQDYQPGLGVVGPWRPSTPAPGPHSAQYVLYATAPGLRAQETTGLRGKGVFHTALMDGLRGAPKALVFSQANHRYEARFSSLVAHVRQQVGDQIKRLAPKDWEKYIQIPEEQVQGGTGDPVLISFQPEEIAALEYKVRLSPSQARENGRLQIMQYLSGLKREIGIDEKGPPAPLPAVFLLPPGDYSLRASSQGYKEFPKPIPLYEPLSEDVKLEPDTGKWGTELTSVESTREIPEMGPPEEYGKLVVRVEDPAAVLVVLDPERHVLGSGVSEISFQDLAPGIYRAQMLVPGLEAQEKVVEVKAGKVAHETFAAPALPLGQAQIQSLRQRGIAPTESGYLYPSEYLHGWTYTSLASLLGMAAYAAHWPSGGFEKLKEFGIKPLEEVTPGRAGVLVLVGAAMDEPLPDWPLDRYLEGIEIVARTLRGKVLKLGGAQKLEGFSGAAQFRLLARPGTIDLRLKLPGLAPTHYALAALPNRVTVLTVSLEEGSRIEVQQYIFPLAHLPKPEGFVESLFIDPSNIRRLELAQRIYAKGGSLPLGEAAAEGTVLPGQPPRPEDLLTAANLVELMRGRWVDPLTACLAGYSLVRQGKTELLASLPDKKSGLGKWDRSPKEILLQDYPELPDSHVLAGLAKPEWRAEHMANAVRRGLPVFTEGYRALVDWYRERNKPLPVSLDWVSTGFQPASPWTSWISLRPALLIQNGHFATPPASWNILEVKRPQIEQAIACVGRIEVGGHPSYSWVGTGFLAAQDVVLVPSYMLGIVCDIGNEGKGHFKPGVNCWIDFREEHGNAPAAEFDLTELLSISEQDGVALLRVAPKSKQGGSLPAPLVLAGAPPRRLQRRRLYMIGYPAYDMRNPVELQRLVFGEVFDVKRLQPSVLLEMDPGSNHFAHDCFSSGGSGGSPVIDLATNQVLGMQYGGRFDPEQGKKFAFARALWPLREKEAYLGLNWGE